MVYDQRRQPVVGRRKGVNKSFSHFSTVRGTGLAVPLCPSRSQLAFCKWICTSCPYSYILYCVFFPSKPHARRFKPPWPHTANAHQRRLILSSTVSTTDATFMYIDIRVWKVATRVVVVTSFVSSVLFYRQLPLSRFFFFRSFFFVSVRSM